MGIELPGAAEQHQPTLVAVQEGHEVPRVDDVRQVGVFAVQVAEPLGVQLADGEVTLEHLAGLGYAEFLGAKKAQQEGCVWKRRGWFILILVVRRGKFNLGRSTKDMK